MSEKFIVGQIIEGKVTDIKPFGAFVALDEETQGLVHISQVAHDFVRDVNDHLKIGDIVKVKIVSIDAQTRKISLSIKEAQPAPERNFRKPMGNKPPFKSQEQQKPQDAVSFEDKLKDWLKQSNERQTELNKRNKR